MAVKPDQFKVFSIMKGPSKVLSFFALALFLSSPLFVQAQENNFTELEVIPENIEDPMKGGPLKEDFYKGEVVEIVEEEEVDLGLGENKSLHQKVKVIFREGPKEGEEVLIDYGSLSEAKRLSANDGVIIVVPQNVQAYIFDKYRLPALGGALVLFAVLSIVFAGWRGFTSLLGLGATVAVLMWYAIPQIIAGKNPLFVSFVSALFIAVVSVYLSHGFKKRTSVAVVSILITVLFAIGLAQFFVNWSGLSGLGSEEAFHLQTSPISFVNLKGLLLGGIIIGALGVLDDVTTAQAAAVEEIWRANPKLTRRELYKRSSSVGKEHITSMINTLAIAYIGASFPALLLFIVYQRPWWVVANTEQISEEVIRTLVGSIALMLAVPITTLIAVYVLPGRTPSFNQETGRDGKNDHINSEYQSEGPAEIINKERQ